VPRKKTKKVFSRGRAHWHPRGERHLTDLTMVATRRSSAAGSARVGSARGASRVPTEAKLVFAVAGIFFAFGAFAVLQEDVYRTSYAGERFSATFLVLIVERGVNTAVGAVGAFLLARSGRGDASADRVRSRSEPKTRVPVAAIATSGVSQMLAMAFANEALRFVSFPTQVLGKSCKMIPVMIGGVVAGRKYPASQYAQVAVVTAGVVAFNLGKSRRVSLGVSRSGAEQLERDSAYGLSLIAASLAMDLVTAALQDRVKTATLRLNPEKKSPKTSMFTSMLWTNLGGACAAFCIAAGTGQLASGVSFCARHAAAARNVAFYALASVIGQLFVYFTITEFDPLVLSTVTTTRKIFSTVYSAARSPAAALNKTQWGGCAAVFAAIAWETLEKYRRAQGAKRLGGKKNA
jgi:UDP-galactose transporter B1